MILGAGQFFGVDDTILKEGEHAYSMLCRSATGIVLCFKKIVSALERDSAGCAESLSH